MRWAILILFLSSGALAVPNTIQQEGYLMNDLGIPLEGATQVDFKLYGQAEGGVALWTESHNLNLISGYFSVILGAQNPLGDHLQADARFLGITLANVEMSPRVQLSSAPYALLAQDVLGDIQPHSVHVGGAQIIDAGGNWVGPPIDGTNDGVGYDTPQAILDAVKTVDGASSGLDADILDGQDSAAFIKGDETMALVLDRDSTGSGLDADTLDGHDSAAFVRTAAQGLGLLVTVDGINSGVDADHLDGVDGAALMRGTDPNVATQLRGLVLGVDGDGSGLEADRLDGFDSSELMKAGQAATAGQILNMIKTVDGDGTGLDADVVDGLQSDSFMRVDADTGTSGSLSIGNILSGADGQLTGTLTANRVEANVTQVPNAQMTPQNAPPNAPLAGMIYFNSQVSDLRVYTGSRWEPIGGFQVGNIFGNGSDGELTVNSANTVVNHYAYINANVAQNSATINVNDASNFSAGDEILIIQMQEGDGSAYTAGVHEFKTIDGKNGNQLILSSELQNIYGHSGPDSTNATVAQVVRVPHYTDVTVNGGQSITAPAWNGYVGGIVIFRATGVVTTNGTIDASQKGFRGGDCNGCGNATWGDQGEGISGRGGQSIQSHSNGGGGGYGPSGCGGSCGGGGGHATVGGVGDHTHCAGVDSLGGSVIGDPTLEKIFFGGAGGGGGDNDGLSPYPQYADGGGIVIISANQIIDARIYSKGEDEIYSGGAGGQTGGGAGGTIWLRANEVTISTVDARGGAGGFNDGYCIGGAGGDGRIKITSVVDVLGVSTPAHHAEQL